MLIMAKADFEKLLGPVAPWLDSATALRVFEVTPALRALPAREDNNLRTQLHSDCDLGCLLCRVIYFVVLLLFPCFCAAGMLCAAMCGARAGAVPGAQDYAWRLVDPAPGCLWEEVERLKRVKKVCWRRG